MRKLDVIQAHAGIQTRPKRRDDRLQDWGLAECVARCF
jgi:hypothetical protein